MQLSIKASGTPVEVKQAVQTAVQRARGNNGRDVETADAVVLVSVRDYVSKIVDAAGPNDRVSVDVTIDAKITVEPATPPAVLTREGAETAAAILAGAPVATSGVRRRPPAEDPIPST